MSIETIIAWLKVWKWPEYIMGFLKKRQELREATAKADKAVQELNEYKQEQPLREEKRKGEDFELRVQKMMRAIREKHSRAPDAKLDVEENDPEVRREALRRIMEEDSKNRWRG